MARWIHDPKRIVYTIVVPIDVYIACHKSYRTDEDRAGE